MEEEFNVQRREEAPRNTEAPGRELIVPAPRDRVGEIVVEVGSWVIGGGLVLSILLMPFFGPWPFLVWLLCLAMLVLFVACLGAVARWQRRQKMAESSKTDSSKSDVTANLFGQAVESPYELAEEDPEHTLTVPGDHSSQAIIDAIDVFLRTSKLGPWQLDQGDHVRRRYKRGAWRRNNIGDWTPFISLLSCPTVASLGRPEDGSLKDWPMLLDVFVRPGADSTSIRLEYRSGLSEVPPETLFLSTTSTKNRRARQAKVAFDFYVQKGEAETRSLSAYLQDRFHLPVAPTFELARRSNVYLPNGGGLGLYWWLLIVATVAFLDSRSIWITCVISGATLLFFMGMALVINAEARRKQRLLLGK